MIPCRTGSKCRTIGDKNRQALLNHPMICTLCDSWAPSGIIGNQLYVIILGIVGTAITIFDVIRIMNYQSSTKYPSRRQSTDMVAMAIERDLKLMTSVLVIEHHTLIMIGAVTEYPILHIPWLVMQICVIIVEIGAFFTRIVMDGLYIQRSEILQAIIVVFHWLQVFCLCIRQFKQTSL